MNVIAYTGGMAAGENFQVFLGRQRLITPICSLMSVKQEKIWRPEC